MKLRLQIILIGLMAFIASSFTFTEGQLLTVVASSGLKLRVSPSPSASMLKVIPYGEKVKVLNASEYTARADRINWLDGHWIEVEYRGVRGYVFDGFLSSMPVPDNEFEQIQADLIIAIPLESYVRDKLMTIQEKDTLFYGDSFSKCVFTDPAGTVLTATEDEFYYEVDVFLPGISIPEIYNTLLGMAESTFERSFLLDNSVFIEGSDGKVKEIRIDGAATTIKKEGTNDVRIKSLVRYFDGV